MNPFEKIPGADDGGLDDDIKKVRENLDRPIPEEQKIFLDKVNTAEDEIRDEYGKYFSRLDDNEVAALIAKRVVENDEELQKEIKEITSSVKKD